MRTPLRLPPELTIFVASELRAAWLEWLAVAADGADPTLDGQAVEDVDAAGVQLLLSLVRSVQARQLDVRIEHPSDALRKACKTLGAAHLLTPAAGVPA
jgi:anti-anti-sigma regulatory factor